MLLGGAAAAALQLRDDSGAKSRADGSTSSVERTQASSADPSTCGADDLRCLELTYAGLAGREDAAAALEELTGQLRQGTLNRRACHVAAHAIGKAAPEEAGEALSVTPSLASLCGAGYYHGAFVKILSGSEGSDIEDRLDTICADQTTAKGDCEHGLGHGLASYSSGKVDTALEMCGRLDAPAASNCRSGVFMESLTPEDPRSGTAAVADRQFEPCDKLPRTYAKECYPYAAARISSQPSVDWQDLLDRCQTLDGARLASLKTSGEAYCSRAVSYEIGSERANSMATIRKLCSKRGAFRAMCLGEAVFSRQAKTCVDRSGRFGDACSQRVHDGWNDVLTASEYRYVCGVFGRCR